MKTTIFEIVKKALIGNTIKAYCPYEMGYVFGKVTEVIDFMGSDGDYYFTAVFNGGASSVEIYVSGGYGDGFEILGDE